ncbi:hypothetical protein BDY17DRAFT_182972 [Neohortaea acidophila]|uniref:F-box domain-containing protein n=1 Tax=Neohortaea acidophila TaxID=245834 RepID=A0A6A6PMH4_9PEZI|nr:uncharacterized protein BDY17DRAFT_182972 [Neohortaea acidophila]KAF2481115.1 hypothetical protein BDY17DRAFT_182972 [Neohortaea acidophila]
MLEKRMKLVELMDQNKQPKEDVDQDSDGVICAEGRVSSCTTADIEVAENIFALPRELGAHDTSSTEVSHPHASPTSSIQRTHHLQSLHDCFAGLPLELVLRIGYFAVVNPEPIQLFHPSSKEYSNMPALLAQPAMTRVNKSFRATLLPAFYEQNGFVIHDDWLDMNIVSEWLRAIGLVNRCRLHWLYFTSEREDLGRVLYRMDFGRHSRVVLWEPMPETAQMLLLDLGFFPDAAEATGVCSVRFMVTERIDLAEIASVARVEGPRVRRSLSVGTSQGVSSQRDRSW